MKYKDIIEDLVCTGLGVILVTWTKDPFLSIFILLILLVIYKLIRAFFSK
ncbi:hypothetical protein [Peptoniphilus phoceensis]|nr:hypothetical protein [Peptoniphilus phoceensis]